MGVAAETWQSLRVSGGQWPRGGGALSVTRSHILHPRSFCQLPGFSELFFPAKLTNWSARRSACGPDLTKCTLPYKAERMGEKTNQRAQSSRGSKGCAGSLLHGPHPLFRCGD